MSVKHIREVICDFYKNRMMASTLFKEELERSCKFCNKVIDIHKDNYMNGLS